MWEELLYYSSSDYYGQYIVVAVMTIYHEYDIVVVTTIYYE